MNLKLEPSPVGWVRTMRPGKGTEFISIVRVIYEQFGGEAVLDLGCGEGHATRHFRGVWIDLEPRFTEPHAVIFKYDIKKFDELDAVKNSRFSLLTMFDVIEHLTREDGLSILERAGNYCDAALIFTPIGPLWIKDTIGDSIHEHRSGWYPEEFWDNGWTVWEWPVFH